MTKPSVIVYGPPGCGKTRNAEALCQHFGLRRVLDHGADLSVVQPAYPPTDTLILTIFKPPREIRTRAIPFEEAMRMIAA